MLLQKENRAVESSGVQQVARATIKASSKIFSFFSDQTYSNKPVSICRELGANAVDSHVMAGKPDLPIDIWLPTILEPTFKVVDHGLGMSHDFIMNDFMAWADGSTKDQSNIAIGGLGIGSKSPFSYVDQFTIVSRFDGVEGVYSLFKDEDGVPAIGLLGQRTTDECNGVSVEIPIKPDDFATFEQAAFQALRYFEPLPIIHNATEGSFNPPQYVSRGKTWGMRPESGDLVIVMGGVAYPVNVSNLSYRFPSDSAAYKLLRYGLDLRVPIGSCSVALSREALSYDDRTVDAIREACENVIEEVKESFATIFDHLDSAWEAAAALYRETGASIYHRSDRAKFLSDHAKWKGAELRTNLLFPKLASHTLDGKTYERWGYQVCEIEDEEQRRGRGGKIRPPKTSWAYPDNGMKDDLGFHPGRIPVLMIDDLPQKPSSKAARKIKEFAEENGGRIMVIRPEEGVTIDLEAFGSPPADIVVFTSSLPEPLIERVYKKTKRPKVRMFTWDGTSHTSYKNGFVESLNPGGYGKLGVDEIPYETQPETGILVVMEQFTPPDGLRQLVDSGLIHWFELLFVNSSDAKKLKGFQKYDEVFERRKKDRLAQYPQLAQRLAVYHEPCLKYVFDFFRHNPNVDFSSRKPLGQIFKLYKEYVEPLDSEQHKLARFVTQKLPRGVKPEELIQKLKDRQRKAWRLIQVLPARLDEEDLKLFQENL